MRAMRSACCVAAGVTGGLMCGPMAVAAFVPISATRTIQVSLRPSVTSTALGLFENSNGSTDGAGSPPTTVSISTSQSSFIPDPGVINPVITYSGTISGSRTAGATTNRRVDATNEFLLNFELTTPMTLVHTLAITSGSTPFGSTISARVNSTDLLSLPGGQIELGAGTHQLRLFLSGGVGWAPSSFSGTSTLAGDVRFIPGPSAAIGIIAPAIGALALRRRRVGR